MGLRRYAPAVWATQGESALFQGLEGLAQTCIVNAELCAQGGSGEGLRCTLQFGAYGFGQRRRCGIGAAQFKAAGLVRATGQSHQHRFRRGCGPVLDAESQMPIAAANEVAGRVGPGVEVGTATQGLPGVPVRTLRHVVDQDKGEMVAAIELAQESEQPRDICGAVLV